MHPKCLQHHSMGWGSRLQKKQKISWAPARITACFLTAGTMFSCPLKLLLPCLLSPWWAKIGPSFLGLFIRHLITAMRKAMLQSNQSFTPIHILQDFHAQDYCCPRSPEQVPEDQDLSLPYLSLPMETTEKFLLPFPSLRLPPKCLVLPCLGLHGETCLIFLSISEYNKLIPLGQPFLWLYDSPLLTKAQTWGPCLLCSRYSYLLSHLCSFFSVPCFMVPLLPWGYFL